jgi:S-adenosylmethionine-diacylglycerol 3-amino-3-carboxypropyl transferase
MTRKYFTNLNYTLSNEDTRVELSAIKKLKLKRILSIAGSGSRSLPFLSEEIECLHVIDTSKKQLELNQFRYELLKKDYQNYLTQLGYIGDSDLVYSGAWEKTFQKFSKLIRSIISRKVLEKFCEIDNLDDQIKFYNTKFPKKRWSALTYVIGNKAMFNSLLYKGSFIIKNIDKTYLKFYEDVFYHLFHHTLAKENFFLQLLFFGEVIKPEAYPIEAHPHIFKACHANLSKTEFKTIEGSVFDMELESKYDFISISDVPSYLAGTDEIDYLNNLASHLLPKGYILVRNYLRTPLVDLSKFIDRTHLIKKEINEEFIGVYDIKLYQKSE